MKRSEYLRRWAENADVNAFGFFTFAPDAGFCEHYNALQDEWFSFFLGQAPQDESLRNERVMLLLFLALAEEEE